MAKPSAWGSQQPQPLLGPSPLQGKGCNRSHPLARSLRYPRPIRESRGDSLRNRVAIVCVRSAHLNTKNHSILVLCCDCSCSLRSLQCKKPSNFGSCWDCFAGFAQVTPTLLVTNCPTHKMKPGITISTQRHRDTEFLFSSVSLCLCVVFIYDSQQRNYL